MNKIFALLVFLIGFPAWASFVGFVISCLWVWFVVPLGLPPVSIPHAIGLALLLSCLHSNSVAAPSGQPSFWPLVSLLGVPSFALAAGFLLRYFV